MSDDSNLTQVQQDTGGAIIPDVTDFFSDIISAAIMVPMGDQGPSDPNCRMGLPTIFWGLSGIAKSDKVKQGGMKVGLPTKVVFPGQKQPEEFGDVPVVMGVENKAGKVQDQLMSACMLSQVNELNRLASDPEDPSGGVLFVDEASCATPATQGAMLGMVLDRAVGATAIDPSVRILLAANPPSYAAGGWGLEPPFANRMAHFYVRCPSVTAWSDWLLTEQSRRVTPIEGPMNKLRTNWPQAWSLTRGQMIGFMTSRQTLLHQQPTPDHPQAGYCWPSPRSWVMAGKALATIRSLGMSTELEQLFVEACVGIGPAAEWCVWMAEVDLPDPRDALLKGWDIDTDRLDKVMAISSSIVAYVIGMPNEEERYGMAVHAWTRLHELIKKGLSDIALKHAMTLSEEDCGYSNRKAPPELKKASKPVLQELGDTNKGVSDFVDP